MQNLGIFLTDIHYKIFKKNKKNPWKKGRICSEILYSKCFKVLLPFLDYDEDKIKPEHIEEIIDKYFYKKDDLYLLK